MGKTCVPNKANAAVGLLRSAALRATSLFEPAADSRDVGWTMRLSFIDTGSSDRPLLMLSGFGEHELTALRETAGDLASGQRDEADLRGDPASDLRLMFRVADRNVGIRSRPPRFECALQRATWSSIEGLIEPFLHDHSGFQWLDESGEVALLLSPHGTW